MPVFLAALLGGLANVAGTIAGRVFIALGISVVTYQGLDTSLGWLKSQAVANITSLPTEVVGMISAMGVGQAISIIASAYAARMTLAGITSGTFKDWVKK